MTEQPEHPLVAEIQHWNDVIAMRYRQLLEAATALDLNTVDRHLAVVRRLQHHSQQFSDQHLLTLLTDPAGGSADSTPEDQTRLLRADHMILSRTLEMVADAAAELEQIKGNDRSALRSALVERLDLFVRFDNILSKHHQRQLELIAPVVEDIMSEQEGRRLATELGDLMQPLKLH